MKTFRAQGEEEDDDDEDDEGSRIACPVNSLSIEERAKDGEVRSIVTPVAAVAAAAILACCDFLLPSSSRCFYDRLKIAPSTSQTSGKNFGATSKKRQCNNQSRIAMAENEEDDGKWKKNTYLNCNDTSPTSRNRGPFATAVQ
jgi:hypothetical protein